MITDKQFITEENKEEISSVIESFLNRLKSTDWGVLNEKGIAIVSYPNKNNLVIMDSAKDRIIKQMIKDFKRYKN